LALLAIRILAVGSPAEAVGAEEMVETGVEGLLLLLRLGQRQRQRVLQPGPVLPADQLRRLHGVQRFGDRDTDLCATERGEEIRESPVHRQFPVAASSAAVAV